MPKVDSLVNVLTLGEASAAHPKYRQQTSVHITQTDNAHQLI